MDQSFCPTIQNLPLQGILKRLSQFYSRNRWTYKTHFFHLFIFSSKFNYQNEFKFLQIKAIWRAQGNKRSAHTSNWPPGKQYKQQIQGPSKNMSWLFVALSSSFILYIIMIFLKKFDCLVSVISFFLKKKTRFC